jgi:hypothetical protein
VIPLDWLEEFNQKLAREGIQHNARPFKALLEWSRSTGCSGEFGSPESNAVFQWFYDHSPPGSHDILPVFVGALYYDAAFWPVEVPPGYGTYRLDGRKAVRSMPDPVWARMCSAHSDLATFIAVWADCLDYSCGIADILRPFTADTDWRKFLASADKELRSAARLLCHIRQNSKAIESARMATEMALKGVLCRDPQVTAANVKQRYGHNLTRLVEDVMKTPAGIGLAPVQKLLGAFPEVGARYEGADYPAPQLWAAYSAAQISCTSAVRSITGRDVRSSLQISWPKSQADESL